MTNRETDRQTFAFLQSLLGTENKMEADRKKGFLILKIFFASQTKFYINLFDKLIDEFTDEFMGTMN